mmetsp:Transcript_59304/g.130198  ORF Transcript_59304/g.130198 Transcript_59304/m.130198 type:complete len:498 (+) Transcript_59304:241-1734(+)
MRGTAWPENITTLGKSASYSLYRCICAFMFTHLPFMLQSLQHLSILHLDSSIHGDVVALLLRHHIDHHQWGALFNGCLHALSGSMLTFKVCKEGIRLLSHVVLSQVGPQRWPYHGRPVQVEVVNHLQHGWVPNHDQHLTTAKAAEHEAEAFSQGVDAVDVIDEQYAFALRLMETHHMGSLNICATTDVLVLLAFGHFFQEEVQVLDVLERRAAIERHTALAALGEGAKDLAHEGHLLGFPDGFDVSQAGRQVHLQATDNNHEHSWFRFAFHEVDGLLTQESQDLSQVRLRLTDANPLVLCHNIIELSVEQHVFLLFGGHEVVLNRPGLVVEKEHRGHGFRSVAFHQVQGQLGTAIQPAGSISNEKVVDALLFAELFHGRHLVQLRHDVTNTGITQHSQPISISHQRYSLLDNSCHHHRHSQSRVVVVLDTHLRIGQFQAVGELHVLCQARELSSPGLWKAQRGWHILRLRIAKGLLHEDVLGAFARGPGNGTSLFQC